MLGIRTSIIWLTVFAIAMAHVEAALVVHLRSIYYPGDPLEIFPLVLMSDRDLAIELAREVATIVMIFMVAMLAERRPTHRFGAFVYIFGVWDLFYYLWLKLMIGWPTSWLEWDVLFLIPWPWFGPWLAPVLIAMLFIIWGGLVLVRARAVTWPRPGILLFTLGAFLGVASFLSPALPLLAGGQEAFRDFVPQFFPWVLYAVGVVLMGVGLWCSQIDDGK